MAIIVKISITWPIAIHGLYPKLGTSWVNTKKNQMESKRQLTGTTWGEFSPNENPKHNIMAKLNCFENSSPELKLPGISLLFRGGKQKIFSLKLALYSHYYSGLGHDVGFECCDSILKSIFPKSWSMVFKYLPIK